MIFATFRLALILVFRFLGYITFIFSRKRKGFAEKNLKICFPEKNHKWIDQKIKDSFILLGHSFSDFLLAPFYNKKIINKYVSIENFDYFKDVFNSGKGLILSTAHFGSFELAAHFLALNGYKNLILYNNNFRLFDCLRKRVDELTACIKKQF